jgi:hypothetical protein
MSFSLQEASLQAPMLAHLRKLSAESSRNLALALQALPESLHPFLQAGPIELTPLEKNGVGEMSKVWCLVVSNNSVASKIRQLLPALLAHLQAQGTGVCSVRLAVAKQVRHT